MQLASILAWYQARKGKMFRMLLSLLSLGMCGAIMWYTFPRESHDLAHFLWRALGATMLCVLVYVPMGVYIGHHRYKETGSYDAKDGGW